MKINWKSTCYICLAPLDPYYREAIDWELRLFDKYLQNSNLSFELNNTHIINNTSLCKCCYMNGPIKYNPRIDSLRQIGAIKLISPKTHSITRNELKNWIKDFYKILEENKPK